jgi:hypothetical protein
MALQAIIPRHRYLIAMCVIGVALGRFDEPAPKASS